MNKGLKIGLIVGGVAAMGVAARYFIQPSINYERIGISNGKGIAVIKIGGKSYEVEYNGDTPMGLETGKIGMFFHASINPREDKLGVDVELYRGSKKVGGKSFWLDENGGLKKS